MPHSHVCIQQSIAAPKHFHFSFVHSPTTRFGSPGTQLPPFQTPRIRSAHPIKSSTQPTRVRSAYPLKSSGIATLPGVTRTATRSGHANHRSGVTNIKSSASDYVKMLDDTARLSINQPTKSNTPAKTYTQLNKRIKLQPPTLPRFDFYFTV